MATEKEENMKSIAKVHTLFAMWMIAGIALCSSAPAFGSAPLVSEIETALKTNPDTRHVEVNISQKDNAIVLDGKVQEWSEADKVSLTVAKVDGVTEIINNLVAHR